MGFNYAVTAMLVSFIGFFFAYWQARKILDVPLKSEKVKEIADAIRTGAMAFLKKQYQILFWYVVIVGIILYYFIGQLMALTFVLGCIFSATAGNVGMRIATQANSRTVMAVQKSMMHGLSIAFSSGTVMGMTVTSLGLFGVSMLYLIFNDPSIIYGFGFGASSIALFARVGGGIYTKGADVGADLVGKVEKGIPEDDPRNPAVIADNVGDNVGDVAGMGADLFESYVGSIIVAMVLGASLFDSPFWVLLPLMISAAGIIASILGTYFVFAAKKSSPQTAMNYGIYASSILAAVMTYFIIKYTIGDIGVFWAAMAGLIAGIVIGLATEYYTSEKGGQVQKISEAATTGAGTNVIEGLAVGMFSTVIPVVTVVVAILIAYKYGGGIYGIAISAVGMLSTLGMTLAMDTYGPVADNAAGIAEMAGQGKVARKRSEDLDAVGNTTAAIGKGFAIGSAALTALALFVGYTEVVQLKIIDILQPNVIAGVFIGALMPFLFSAFAMKAVGVAAVHMVEEVRRQWKTIKGIMEGKAKPDYARCVSISTEAALRNMIIPSLLAILAPVVVGLLFGAAAVGGLLAGALSSGFLLAVMMANAGGAWDNAKKYIEAGHFGGKGSDAHKAAVVGDTVGDPFKDTAGPSLHILIKLMSVVAVVFAPLILLYGGII